MTDTERQEQIKEIYGDALECAEPERAAWLAQACAGDDELRREIESLLGRPTPTLSLLETPPLHVVADILAAERAASLIGRRLGHYRIEERIGAGGMGEVYAARDEQLGRQIALKLLPAQFTTDPDRVRRFEREARAASALNHPNILTIHEIGVQDGIHFMATELVAGETLRQRLTRDRLDLPAALDIAAQTATALVAAHEAGIVHRDIKPENLMLRRDGYVKVLDFGLAKLTEATVDEETETLLSLSTNGPHSTAAGLVLGTASYMSPEQARGLKVDARSDIFSLGVVLYEMIAGRRPFSGHNAVETLAAILEREPPPLAEAPPALARIVAKALCKDRAQRYQRAADLLRELKDLKEELEFQAKLQRNSGATAATQTTSSAADILGAFKRHRRGALLTAALAALLIIVAVWFGYARRGPIDSIAVLPFVNASRNPDAEYLSDGISESLINRLSQLPGVKVIARSSSFKYRGETVDPQAAAQALGVGAVLTGRVAERGGNLLISVELMDARDRTQIWGEQYNRRAEDVLAVQAAISGEIVEQLRWKLTETDARRLAQPETLHPQAYELLLKGRYYWNKGGTENRKQAVAYLQQSIAADPTYAPAYAELSSRYGNLVSYNVLDPREFTPRAEETARRAVALDDNLADAHLALANVKRDAWEWAAAEREFKRALDLNPSLARAHSGYSAYLSGLGRHEQAIAEIERARTLDPLSLPINTTVGYKFYYARRYEQALAAAQKTLALDANYPSAHVLLGQIYAAQTRYAEAETAYRQAIKLGGDTSSVRIALGTANARAGNRAAAQAVLKDLQTSRSYLSFAELATLHIALGEREQALAALERAYETRDVQLQFLAIDPALDELRDDARFADLLRRVGLAQ